jgi:hypothetical protein
VVFLAVAIPLVLLALRSRPAPWEAIVIVGLAVAAVRSSRNEVWLALFVAVPAAKALAGSRSWRLKAPRSAAFAVTGLLVLVAIAGLTRTRASAGATPALLHRAEQAAHGTPILADGFDAEQLAVAGDEILIGNPLDAFSPHEQRLYLDWLAGRPQGDAEAGRVRVVVAVVGSAAARRLAARKDFVEAGHDRRAVLYVRKAVSGAFGSSRRSRDGHGTFR